MWNCGTEIKISKKYSYKVCFVTSKFNIYDSPIQISITYVSSCRVSRKERHDVAKAAKLFAIIA